MFLPPPPRTRRSKDASPYGSSSPRREAEKKHLTVKCAMPWTGGDMQLINKRRWAFRGRLLGCWLGSSRASETTARRHCRGGRDSRLDSFTEIKSERSFIPLWPPFSVCSNLYLPSRDMTRKLRVRGGFSALVLRSIQPASISFLDLSYPGWGSGDS